MNSHSVNLSFNFKTVQFSMPKNNFVVLEAFLCKCQNITKSEWIQVCFVPATCAVWFSCFPLMAFVWPGRVPPHPHLPRWRCCLCDATGKVGKSITKRHTFAFPQPPKPLHRMLQQYSRSTTAMCCDEWSWRTKNRTWLRPLVSGEVAFLTYFLSHYITLSENSNLGKSMFYIFRLIWI